jgi:transcriptional regulator with XRE-family HTH domain
MASAGIPLRRSTTSAREQVFRGVVGAAVRRAREEANLTRGDVAKRIGMSESTVVNIEQGNSCSTFAIALIAEELDVPIDTLIPTEATK